MRELDGFVNPLRGCCLCKFSGAISCMYCRTADELERVAAKVDEQHVLITQSALAGTELLAERDRLTAQRDDYCRQLTQGIRAMRDVCLERDRLLAALTDLMKEPECVDLPNRGVYGKIDRSLPLWCEATLYELVGKEAARTILAYRRNAQEALAGAGLKSSVDPDKYRASETTPHHHNYTPWFNDGTGGEHRYCECGAGEHRETR